MNRSRQRDWLVKSCFLCYSEIAMVCFAQLVFQYTHRVAKQLISEPYQDWENIHEDIKNHAVIEYHLNSMTQLNKFMRTMNNPEKGIGVTISEKDKEKFEENREILTCIIKCLEFYGRLGIGLKDHRDDN